MKEIILIIMILIVPLTSSVAGKKKETDYKNYVSCVKEYNQLVKDYNRLYDACIITDDQEKQKKRRKAKKQIRKKGKKVHKTR